MDKKTVKPKKMGKKKGGPLRELIAHIQQKEGRLRRPRKDSQNLNTVSGKGGYGS